VQLDGNFCPATLYASVPTGRRLAGIPQIAPQTTADACHALGRTLARATAKTFAPSLFWRQSRSSCNASVSPSRDFQPVVGLFDPNRL
jgi:hypothetical protein